MKTRIILVGKGGSGKDHMKNYLIKVLGLRKEVSYTTRPMREGEVPGFTYNYVSEEKFTEIENSGALKESVNFNGWRYGTTKNAWKDAQVFIFTPTGLKSVSEEDRKESVVVYFDIAEDVRLERLKARKDLDNPERRLAEDEKDFKDYRDYDIRVFDPLFNAEDVYNTCVEEGFNA